MLTNLFECLNRDEWLGFLALCDLDESQVGSFSSDYENWRALCHALPQMKGSGRKEALCDYLTRAFSISKEINTATCDEIWKAVSDALPEKQPKERLSAKNFAVAKEFVTESDMKKAEIKEFVSDVTVLSILSRYHVYSEWERALREAINGKTVVVTLPKDYVFSSPNPYSVNQMLSEKEPMQESVIFTQLLRLSVQENRQIVLIASCSWRENQKVLEYLQKLNPRSPIFLCCEDHENFKELAKLQSVNKWNFLRFAVLSDKMQGNPQRIQALAKFFPIGNLYELLGF